MRSRRLLDLSGIQWVRPRPFVGGLVEALDVGIQLPAIDPPDSTAPDLYRGKLPRAHQRVNLRDADVEVIGHVLERHEARFDPRRGRAGAPGFIHVVQQGNTQSSRIPDLDSICSRLTPLASRKPAREVC